MLGLTAFLALGTFALLLWALRRSTDRHAVQTELLSSILDSMGDGLMTIDHQGKITQANPAAEKLLGFSPLGRKMEDVARTVNAQDAHTSEEVGRRNSPLKRALQGESRDDYEISIESPEGRRLLSISTRPVRGRQGEIVGALEVIRDVTTKKAIEREWQTARDSALEASRLKSDFLANMSHEIRTPMNGVMGLATLLLDSPLSAQQLHFVKMIKSSADGLLTLINQVLDHSKIESGALQLERAPFALHEAVEGVITMLLYQARSKKGQLELHWAQDLPERVVGDLHRLRQVLIHLVSHSLRGGSVHVHARLEPSHAGEVRVGFRVVGQAAATLTGLSHIITQELVRLMGGEIDVKDNSLSFTLVFAEAEAAGSVKPTALAGHILVAEDQKINQLVIEKFLARLGLTCEIVVDGSAALQRLQEKRFDLVLMDCHMRPMDGYEATRLIRESEKQSGEHLPIIAITAEGQSGDRTRCFEVGMDDVLSKPVEMDRLQRTLGGWLGRAVTPEFDEEVLDRLSGYDSAGKTLAQALAADYLQDSKVLVDAVRTSATRQDWLAVVDAAHALRGSSLTLGLTKVGVLCAQWELAPASMPIHELEDAWMRACQLLQKFLNRAAA